MDGSDPLSFLDPDFLSTADASHVLGAALDAALHLTRADMGNVQLVDPDCGGLVIAAQRGFEPRFLRFFARVRDDASAWTGARQPQAGHRRERRPESHLPRHGGTRRDARGPCRRCAVDAHHRPIRTHPRCALDPLLQGGKDSGAGASHDRSARRTIGALAGADGLPRSGRHHLYRPPHSLTR